MTTALPLAARRRGLIVAACALAATAVVAWRLQAGPAQASVAAKAPPLVAVTAARVQDLPLRFDAQGHVAALSQVDVRPQAGGIIRGIHFKEGDEVRAGQLMFTIDATDVSAQLARARAAAAQIKAQLDESARNLDRTRQLAQSRFYATSAVDTAESTAESLRAQYQAAQADVANAQVAVDHTRIVAPLTGLSGALSAHLGSVAQPTSATPLLNVMQVDPIGVDFTLPEAQLADVVAARAAGDVRVRLDLPGGRAREGRLVFVDNTVDTTTGTIALKAEFANADRALWPGAFVRVRVDAGRSRAAVTLPPQSVLDGPAGRLVYVVDAGGRVGAVPVTLLRLQDQLAVVDGLRGGERVVAEGQAVLRPGMAVRVAAAAASAASGSAR